MSLRNEIKESFDLESTAVSPDSVARVVKAAASARSAGQRRYRPLIPAFVAGAFVALVVGIAATVPWHTARDSSTARPRSDSLASAPVSPGDGPPCSGAEKISPEALQKFPERQLFLPAGTTLDDAKAIWACGGMSAMSPVAIQFADNRIAISTPVDPTELLSDKELTENYEGYIGALNEQDLTSLDGTDPYIMHIDNQPALVIPRFEQSVQALVEFQIDSTRVQLVDDGTHSTEQLVKVAESLQPAKLQ